jgi:hypothetical protein
MIMITRKNMKTCLVPLTLLTVGSFLGCSQESANSPDVSDGIRTEPSLKS